MKASDVWRESKPVFTERVHFERAFPEIDEISVEVGQSKYGNRDSIKTSYYSKDNLEEYIDCTNPICYNGGIRIGKILRNIVKERHTYYEGNQLCQGNEGSPKGRRIYNICPQFFWITVDIKYKKGKTQFS